MARRLKKWNGLVMFRGGQRSVYIAAYTQKDALELLEGYGHPTSMYEFRGWWSPGWGNPMLPICGFDQEPPKRGMWVGAWHSGGGDEKPRFIEPGTKVY